MRKAPASVMQGHDEVKEEERRGRWLREVKAGFHTGDIGTHFFPSRVWLHYEQKATATETVTATNN